METLEVFKKAVERRTMRNLILALPDHFESELQNPEFAEKFANKITKFGAGTCLTRCLEHVRVFAIKWIRENYPKEVAEHYYDGYGDDVPDELCLESASEYFLLEEAEEDKKKKPPVVTPTKSATPNGTKAEEKKKGKKKKMEDAQISMDLSAHMEDNYIPCLDDPATEIPEDSATPNSVTPKEVTPQPVETKPTDTVEDSVPTPFPEVGHFNGSSDDLVVSDEGDDNPFDEDDNVDDVAPVDEPASPKPEKATEKDPELESALNTVLTFSADKGKTIRELLEARGSEEKSKLLLQYFIENPRIAKLGPDVVAAAKVIMDKRYAYAT